MVAGKSELARVAEADESGIEITYSGGHTVRVTMDDISDDMDPQYNREGRGPDLVEEGLYTVDCYASNPPGSWETGYCSLVASTDGGEWGRVELVVGDPEDDIHPLQGETARYDVGRLTTAVAPEHEDADILSDRVSTGDVVEIEFEDDTYGVHRGKVVGVLESEDGTSEIDVQIGNAGVSSSVPSKDYFTIDLVEVHGQDSQMYAVGNTPNENVEDMGDVERVDVTHNSDG